MTTQTTINGTPSNFDEILATFPKPWVQSKADAIALTSNGRNALLGILLLHDYPCWKQLTGKRDRREYELLLTGSQLFCEEHKGTTESCVPTIQNDGLSIMMTVLRFQFMDEMLREGL